MKKIIFCTMIASLLAFVGCQNEELVNDNSTDNSNGKKVTLTANIAGSTDSRVALNPGTDSNSNPIVNVEWEESGEQFTVYNSDHSKSAVFTQSEGNEFDCPEDEYNELGGAKYAYYGYDETRSYDLSAQNGTLDKKCILMVADVSSSPSNITFEHKTAILKVNFKVGSESINADIDKVVLDGANAGSGKNQIIVSRTQVEVDEKDDIYIFLPIDDTYSSSEKNFMFTVFVDVKNYTGNINIPTGRIEAGNLYTATISLQEVNYCNVPWGDRFKTYIKPLLIEGITGIRFVANSQNMGNASVISSDKFPANLKYIYNESTLELHTDADFFVFNYDCSYMFTSMEKIVSIDFGNRINTFAIQNMNSMFAGCKMLTGLDLNNFNMENVTDMSQMFKFCESIEILDLSSFNMNSVTKITSMFYGCNNLGNLILSDNFLSSVTQANSVLGRDGNNKKEIWIDFKNANANIYTLRMLKSAYPYYNQTILYFNAIVNQYSFEYLSSQNPGNAFLQRLFKREDDGSITPWVSSN